MLGLVLACVYKNDFCQAAKRKKTRYKMWKFKIKTVILREFYIY